MPGFESFHTKSEQFHISIGQLYYSESQTIVNTPADNTFKHQITLNNKTV